MSNNIEKQIKDLIGNSGKASSEMTRALKFIGDGNMQQGLVRIAEYFTKAGEKTGFKKGTVVGLVTASLLYGIGTLIKAKIDKDKKLAEEGNAILRELEEGLSKKKE